MRIVIIGSGNVATVLGRLLKKNNHEIVQVISPNAENAKRLASELGCSATSAFAQIDCSADLYLVSILDGALYELPGNFNLSNKLIVHTAGSVPADVLKDISINYGVLYPLQTLRKEKDYTADIPFLVEGNTNETTVFIEDLARELSANVLRVTEEERLKMHVAAVVVSNFTNHLYALAEGFCKEEHIDFNMLKPLIRETAERVETLAAHEAQTGPAIRKDVFTLDKHIRMLSNHPKLKYLYLKMTESIMKN